LDPTEDRFRVRALRATPPGRASHDPERRRVFASALGQFDELLDAAAAAGAASRPLPLYYAVSQATTAIAAALSEPGRIWLPGSHGLTVGEPDPRFLGSTSIRSQPRRRKGEIDTSDSFSILCDAINEPGLTRPTSISAVWAALPELDQNPGLGAGHPRALALEFDPHSPHAVFGTLTIEGVPVSEGGLKQVRGLLKDHYPAYHEGLTVQGIQHGSRGNDAQVEIFWTSSDGIHRDLRLHATEYLGGHWLLPSVNARNTLSPLLLWWCLLYALSDLARYHPAEWTAALDPVSARDAVSIEKALSTALSVIPRLVLKTLVPAAYLTP
jgi:hypothetical protein